MPPLVPLTLDMIGGSAQRPTVPIADQMTALINRAREYCYHAQHAISDGNIARAHDCMASAIEKVNRLDDLHHQRTESYRGN